MQIFPVFIPNMGCPHQCLFCDQTRSNSLPGNLSPDVLSSLLDSQLPDKGQGEIAFYGGSFTLLPDLLMASCLEVAAKFVTAERVRGIRVSTRPDALSAKTIDRLVAAKVTTIEIGCQSFCDDVLIRAGRGHSAQDSRDAVLRCRQARLHVGIQLMPALPGALPEEALASLDSAIACQPDFLRIYPTVVLAGTALAQLWERGEYRPWSLDLAVDICARMLLRARRASVRVIRMGLQDDPVLLDNLLDGPHHPAFGQLVRSRLWRLALSRLAPESVPLQVNPRDLSDASGHRGENRCWLAEKHPGSKLAVDPRIPAGHIGSQQQLWSLDELAAEEICHA